MYTKLQLELFGNLAADLQDKAELLKHLSSEEESSSAYMDRLKNMSLFENAANTIMDLVIEIERYKYLENKRRKVQKSLVRKKA